MQIPTDHTVGASIIKQSMVYMNAKFLLECRHRRILANHGPVRLIAISGGHMLTKAELAIVNSDEPYSDPPYVPPAVSSKSHN